MKVSDGWRCGSLVTDRRDAESAEKILVKFSVLCASAVNNILASVVGGLLGKR